MFPWICYVRPCWGALLSAGDCGARQIQKAGIKSNTTDVTVKDLSSEWSRNVLPVKRLRSHKYACRGAIVLERE
jgi:hypothetical protein